MDKQLLKQLKARSHSLSALVRIGRAGLSDHVLAEITKQLKKNKLVKIKILNSFESDLSRKALAAHIAEKTDSELVHVVGGTVVLWRR